MWSLFITVSSCFSVLSNKFRSTMNKKWFFSWATFTEILPSLSFTFCRCFFPWPQLSRWLWLSPKQLLVQFQLFEKLTSFFSQPFFALEKIFFRVSVQNFGHCRLHEIIGLQLSQCLSANHNPELRCVTGLKINSSAWWLVGPVYLNS